MTSHPCRNTGGEIGSDAVSFADRYAYSTNGLDKAYRNPLVEFGEYRAELLPDWRDYEEITVVSSLDHSYIRVRGEIEFDLSDAWKLTLGAGQSTRAHDDRPARDLGGASSRRARPSANSRKRHEYVSLPASAGPRRRR